MSIAMVSGPTPPGTGVIASADDHRFLTSDWDIAALENLDDSSWSTGHQAGPLRGKKTYVDRVKSVHVLRRVHRHQDLLGINLSRQRKLNQDAINFVPAIQFKNQFQQVLSRNCFRWRKLLAVDTYFFAAFHFAAYVDLRCRVVADQDDGESGTHSGGRQVLYLSRHFRSD